MFTYDQKKKIRKITGSDTLYKQHLRFFLPILTSLCTAVCDVVKAAILVSEAAVPEVASMASSWRTASVTGRPPADSLRRHTIGPNGKKTTKIVFLKDLEFDVIILIIMHATV